METLKFKSERIVGRQNEITQLQSALDELEQGRGKTVLSKFYYIKNSPLFYCLFVKKL